MSTGRVLVTARSFRKIPGEHHAILQRAGLEVIESTQDRPLSEAELVSLIREADAAIIGVDRVTERVLAMAPRLKIISRHGVGYDNVDVAAATARRIVVTIAAGANRTSVAELVIGLMISLARQVPNLSTATKAGGWSRLLGLDLAGKTLGIVGLGRIGREVARRATAFDMTVLAHDIAPDPRFTADNQIVSLPLPELLAASDFVTLHAPFVPDQPPIIGRNELAQMKSTAFLINAARGGLVDEGALYEALKNQRLAGAALDTFVDEPPRGNPLLTLDNVIATPHIGGYTIEATLATGQIAAQNVVDVLTGHYPSEGIVNPDVLEPA